ncbi:MAG: hypothetical protein IJ232_11385 [Lachnospiraceae bacterium]|nr:hypothetical protein [Lachnospiraceae bacterium]
MYEDQRYVDMLLEILNKQIDTLHEALGITKEQEIIANTKEFDSESFDETLSRKDVCIARLNELDNGFVSVYDRVGKIIKSNPDKYKEQILTMQELIRRCTDIGNEIQTLEARNKDKLAACFAGKKQEYNAKQTAATVAGKYNTIMKNVNSAGMGVRFFQDK